MTCYSRDPIYKECPIENEYEIRWGRNLGTGVSGPVRLCIKRQTGKEFALKILLDRADKKKAETEATLHWRCSGGEHIVRIIDVYRNEIRIPGEMGPKRRILLVLELMKGGELFTFISKRHHFTEKEASKYMLQVALGVRFCHRLNIAHRDIKPENLLLEKETDNPEEVYIKLADFGFAKIDNGDLKTPQFTPYYVAPQVLEAQKRQKQNQASFKPNSPYFYDKSCDIWSLGVILYIMLCGYPPFYSEVPHQPLSVRMKQKIMSADFNFPSNDWRHITEDAKNLIRRMLCVEPSERLSIDEVIGHPWISRNASPVHGLNSPGLISDTITVVQETHAKFLNNFRRDDSGFFLKPVALANNPILARCHKKQPSDQTREGLPELSFDLVDPSEGVRSLRELRDMCFMPPPPFANATVSLPDPQFIAGVKKALMFNDNDTSLMSALEQESWSGTEFTGLVNRRRLAESLQDMIQSIPPIVT